MKKTLLAMVILTTVLVGCKGNTKTYGYIVDWTEYPSVTYAVGQDGCYSDGSMDSNWLFKNWVKRYNETH